MFISFEGLDGSGKTTILDRLNQQLTEEYPTLEFVTTREPGGNKVVEAEKIRDIILSKKSRLSPTAEALLYTASRRIHLDQVILPALQKKQIVFCDRYVDSFYAYQGFGRQLGLDFVRSLTNLAIGNIVPDVVFFFDISPEQALSRLNVRKLKSEANRLDEELTNFHKLVYKGYQTLIDENPAHFIKIDATLSADDVFVNVWKKLHNLPAFQQKLKELGYTLK
ncbi:dTMP kinase [Mycoplasmopsis columbinasalis]|uniref:Thymidylate kinase n=1 Tax=Mycoplasmopsis columbinasalis TaxID=114880 RepID=A0A449BB47_9BACT|nr:dTMP kinase [Mycoplasmopsis columbinasalis]VEU78411.1 Thymidylate kinase [Mycoplasmopsis columbinasalis]